MKLEEREFIPVILGGDITTYSLARSFHEEYHIRSIAISMQKNWLNSYSSIIENIIVPNMHKEEIFLKTLLDLGEKRGKDKKLILIACGDWYVRLIIEHRKELSPYYVIPYIEEDLMNRLVLKDSFYEICDQTGVPYPKTFVYDCKEKNELDLPFGFPVIAKPASSAQYHYAEFKGKKKVFKFETMDQLRAMLKELETSSYDYKFLIQDFIPGDDTYMNILTCYCDRNSKVRFMSFGRTLMEDQGPMAIGNPVAIINEVKLDVMNKAKKMLEEVGYTGFANFDIKYDTRDGKYKFFEINCRQGRSNFYVTNSGFNVARYFVEDYVYEKEIPFKTAQEEYLWTVLPNAVAFKYVKDPEMKRRMKKLIKEKKMVNPLFLRGDLGPKRYLRLVKGHLRQFSNYKKYYS